MGEVGHCGLRATAIEGPSHATGASVLAELAGLKPRATDRRVYLMLRMTLAARGLRA